MNTSRSRCRDHIYYNNKMINSLSTAKPCVSLYPSILKLHIKIIKIRSNKQEITFEVIDTESQRPMCNRSENYIMLPKSV